MQIGPTLFSYMPMVGTPDKQVVSEQTPSKHKSEAKQADLILDQKRHNKLYAYHPINAPRTYREGEVVDFVIA